MQKKDSQVPKYLVLNMFMLNAFNAQNVINFVKVNAISLRITSFVIADCMLELKNAQCRRKCAMLNLKQVIFSGVFLSKNKIK